MFNERFPEKPITVKDATAAIQAAVDTQITSKKAVVDPLNPPKPIVVVNP